LQEDFVNAKLNLNESQAKIVEIETKITSSEKEKSLLEIPIKNIKTSIQEIGTGVYPSIADEAYSNNAKIIDELTKIEKSITNEKRVLDEINSNIKTSENFQKEVEQLISKGSEIVNKSQTSSCPLCEQQYESFSVLASKISNNSLLSNILSSLLNQRAYKNNSINQLSESLKSRREKLVNEITKQLEEKEKKYEAILNDLKKSNGSKSEIVKVIELNTKTLNDLVLRLNGKTIETFEKEIRSLLDKLKIEFESLVIKNEEFKNTISSELLKVENAQKKSSNSLGELDRLNNEAVYLKIVTYFKENYPEQIIGEKILSDELALIIDKLKSNSEKEFKLNKEIEDLNLKLNSYTYEAVQGHNELIGKSIDLFLKIINSFEQEVNSKLFITPHS
jgi:DNA repair protein SbcC/Rad50